AKYESDNVSLDSDDLFADLQDAETPSKPLLTAALKAKHQQGGHLENINQPKTRHDDAGSLDSDDLFDDLKDDDMPAKPLLAAALKAKHSTEQEQGKHLQNINQPKTMLDYDNVSLDEDGLFDDIKHDEMPAKPLVTAAVKAKHHAEQEQYSNHGMHLKNIHQPKTKYQDDNKSLDEDDLFADLRDDEMPAKPLLAAAVKAKYTAEQEQYSLQGKHLENTNQPNTNYEDDNVSIDSEYLFEVHDRILPAKPLLAAALQAREDAMQESFSVRGVHLSDLNQPRGLTEEKSMDEDDLFEVELRDAPAKPLLRAAILAREQSKQDQYSVKAEHLKSLNQPKSLLSEEKSIDEVDLFDEPLELAPKKPLLTAAYKAREEQRSRVRRAGGNGSGASHLQYVNQPLVKNYEDDSASLATAEIFEPPSPRSRKPLLTAAQKAKRQQADMPVPEHLRSLCQPESGAFEDDDRSLTTAEIFEPPRDPPPRKPLLAAALRAKEAGVYSRPPAPMTAELIRKNSLDKSRSAAAHKKKLAGKRTKGSGKGSSRAKESDSKSGKKKKSSSTKSKSKSSTKDDKKKEPPSDKGGGGLFSRRGKKSG
ncbi:MAG: hypothetical protein SGILL_001091, partial [Bacillariaceae sp.]